MANINRFPGLARGPIDHEASSLINAITTDVLNMGDAVILSVDEITGEPLPRVSRATAAEEQIYGIVVGGDVDGVYGDGSSTSDDTFLAANAAGQAVVICTQGRCLARVSSTDSNNMTNDVLVAAALTAVAEDGALGQATEDGDQVVARLLQKIESGDLDIVAIDFQREGIVTVTA